MKSLDSKSPSLHLMRARRDDVYISPAGKITLFVCTASPELRPFKGVILQYLIALGTSANAEGLQAIKRYKAYKAMFLEVVATGSLPRRKYRHAMPLYRLALEFRGDSFILSLLHTVFRAYDLYLPTQKVLDAALQDFRDSFLVESPDLQQHNNFVVLQDEVFDFDQQLDDLTSTQAFKEFSKKVMFDRPYEPEEKAILLTKKGTSRWSESSSSHTVKGFAPSIVGSTAELIASETASVKGTSESYLSQVTALGNAIGQRSLPSMVMTFEPPPAGGLSAVLRRNVILGAPGYKTRIIAIGDYNVNYALSPLHKWAFDVLAMIPSDYTFNHDKGFRALSVFTKTSDYVACFDLSNATDALPVKLGESVLRHVAPNGEEIGPLWTRLMVGLPFDGKYYYRVGQPMGFLSSWAVGLALVHHFIVWLAAKKGGDRLLAAVLANPDHFYGVVGDDLFITSPRLAHYYSIIMAALSVKINLTKSLFVDNDKRVSEFVKRNSFNGDEISAISPSLVVKSFNDYACTVELINKTFELSKAPRTGYSAFTTKFVDLYEIMGDGFVRRAISTMCTIPAIYAGLLSDEERAIVPPLVRLALLLNKSLKTIEFKIKSLFIGSSGKVVYNDIANWLLDEGVITEPNGFSRTQMYEYLKKMNTQTDMLFSIQNAEINTIIGLLAEASSKYLFGALQESDFSLIESRVLTLLEAFAPEGALAFKEATRNYSRSLAFKQYRLLSRFRSDPSRSESVFMKGIKQFHDKYSFKLDPTEYDSLEEMYAKLFLSVGEDESSFS